MGEFQLIEWIRRRSGATDRVAFGIGDDCAGLRFSPGADVLVTTDMLMDGRHFRLGDVTPEEIGGKAIGVNLSDIAAMAGTPIAAVVAVALPRSNAEAIAKGLHAGMMQMADRFGVSLVGGDTNAWDGPLVVSVTLLGEVAYGLAARRSGARVGDAIFVTGPLGGSLLGRHLRPEPRIALGQKLGLYGVHAMIDVSDGLVSDLRHILDESGGLGAMLFADAIPIHQDARRMASEDGRDPLDHALNDGEDFELLYTTREEDAARFLALDDGIRQIGIVEALAGFRLRSADGSIREIVARGFDHLA